MANIVFNIALGRGNELARRVINDDPAPSGFVLMLLQTAEADATLRTHATVAAMLAGANTEANFTNYGRINITTGVTVNVDNSGNVHSFDVPNQTFTNAGGTTDNTLAKWVLCYAPDVAGADSTLVPVCAQDFTPTTSGVDLECIINASGVVQAS